jgi:threonine aldolase
VEDLSRRQFLELSVAAAALGLPASAAAALPESSARSDSMIDMQQDGLALKPAQAAAELARLCEAQPPAEDLYGLGGTVEQVEQYFARVLGKERALFMPTGTLANHLALRALAGDRRRVVLQDISHVNNDTGDSSQILSGLTLLPLAQNRATFAWEDVEAALARTASGRVSASVGAISIESPVRRRQGELFDRAEMLRICSEAKKRGIGTHLDGARLFIASAYTGISPADYAAPFDSVYVSLWKCFNSLNGAILAGPADMLDGMFHVRRMFGGALFNAWPFAVLAQHYAEGFVERMRQAIAVSEDFIRRLQSPLSVDRVAAGTNIFRLVVRSQDAQTLPQRLAALDVALPRPSQRDADWVFGIHVNETWNRTTGAALAEKFGQAMAR